MPKRARRGGGSYEGEGLELDLHTPRSGSRLDEDVYLIIFHGGIEILLYHWRKTMNLVNKKDVISFKRCEHTRQIPRLVQHRPGGHLNIHTQLVGNNIREGGLAQSGRPVKEYMVQRLASLFGRPNKHAKVVQHILLTRKTVESFGTQRPLYLAFLLCLTTACSI